MTTQRCSLASLPPHRRGRLRNGAAPGDFLAAAHCGARTRAGGCCRQPAMKNGRCRMHGGLSTGPRTAEGRARCAAVRRTHGLYSADTIALRRTAAAHCHRMDAFFASVKVRRTAGHGLLPANLSNPSNGKARTSSASATAAARSTFFASLRLSGESSAGRGTPAAGHGVLPPLSARPLDSARPLPQRTPRQGFVQRALLGSTALGLGRSIKPPLPAGHGVLPSFSRRAG
jgi:hypothetical protein